MKVKLRGGGKYVFFIEIQKLPPSVTIVSCQDHIWLVVPALAFHMWLYKVSKRRSRLQSLHPAQSHNGTQTPGWLVGWLKDEK